MDEAEARTDWPSEVVTGAKLLAFAILPMAACIYLIYGPGPADSEFIPDWLVTWSPVLVGLVIGGVLLAEPIERLPWYGALPAPVAEGYAWRRSIRSRLVIFAASLVGGWVFAGLINMTYQAYQQVHWPKAVVGSLLLAFCLWPVARLLLSWKPVLVVDSEGLRLGEKGELLPWSRIERITVGHRRGRRATLMTLKRDSAPGPARTLELGEAGISAREFLMRVEEVAPGVEVHWPAEPASVFTH